MITELCLGQSVNLFSVVGTKSAVTTVKSQLRLSLIKGVHHQPA